MTSIEWWMHRGVAHAAYGDGRRYLCGAIRTAADRRTDEKILDRCDKCVEGERAPRFIRTRVAHEADATWRLRVEWEDGELTEVADEMMSSPGDRAKPVSGSIVCLKKDDVRWLHAALGELLAQWDASDVATRKEFAIPENEASDWSLPDDKVTT